MNKKNNTTTDNSTPYRTLGIGKVSAPNKPKNEPKGRVLKGKGDLRVRGGKA